MAKENRLIRWFDDLGSDDTGAVGGKNASLGEMISALKERGVRVPDGFAVTAGAYRMFLEHNGLADPIREKLSKLNDSNLRKTGQSIRKMIRDAEMPEELNEKITAAYAELSERYDEEGVDVAVRSSATAEDLPEASFAGQLESFLNISGPEEVSDACKDCFASLFTDRAISYREQHGFEHMKVALSAGVQKMVRSDSGAAGVMFSIDTDTGFPDAVVIDGAWGLGENIVQGTVDPDEFRVFKPLLSDPSAVPIIDRRKGNKEQRMVYAKDGDETTKNVRTTRKMRERFVLDDDQIVTLARWAVAIEEHYERPMDIEWALDGERNELFIVQARPETVHSQKSAATLHSYHLREEGEKLLEGVAIGQAIAAGPAILLDDPSQGDRFEEGMILVTERTDPDWVPLMRLAGGIVTDHGGRTSHAAIVSRELGVPAIIGAGDATEILKDGQEVTIDCTGGDTGTVYDGTLEYDEREIDISKVPDTRARIMMNVASPAAALQWWKLPTKGVGLARLEFLIGNTIGVHPLALTRYDELESQKVKKEIDRLTRGYEQREEYFVDTLARGIAQIAAAAWPGQALVRLSDFKTNEYAQLLGGDQFEAEEENPMLGFRGAARYYSEDYADGFALECRAIERARGEIGLRNVVVMVPFCRTLEEADRVLGLLAGHGLTRGKDGLEIYMMCEIPSNVILADEFAQRFDGFSIGTNDLTQLVLGIDRDSQRLAHLFDERDEAVKRAILEVIAKAHEAGRQVGLCGQAPSDHPDFAAFLTEAGIDSISVNPDSVLQVIHAVAGAEQPQPA